MTDQKSHSNSLSRAEELDLIRRAKGGEETAWRQIEKREYPRVWKLACAAAKSCGVLDSGLKVDANTFLQKPESDSTKAFSQWDLFIAGLVALPKQLQRFDETRLGNQTEDRLLWGFAEPGVRGSMKEEYVRIVLPVKPSKPIRDLYGPVKSARERLQEQGQRSTPVNILKTLHQGDPESNATIEDVTAVLGMPQSMSIHDPIGGDEGGLRTLADVTPDDVAAAAHESMLDRLSCLDKLHVTRFLLAARPQCLGISDKEARVLRRRVAFDAATGEPAIVGYEEVAQQTGFTIEDCRQQIHRVTKRLLLGMLVLVEFSRWNSIKTIELLRQDHADLLKTPRVKKPFGAEGIDRLRHSYEQWSRENPDASLSRDFWTRR